ncbi:hypothetical protein IFR05_010779 [Cadophora sp. M221]|nr:hypothetical protein IFR05_010779 [Cadophora sp. M221]
MNNPQVPHSTIPKDSTTAPSPSILLPHVPRTLTHYRNGTVVVLHVTLNITREYQLANADHGFELAVVCCFAHGFNEITGAALVGGMVAVHMTAEVEALGMAGCMVDYRAAGVEVEDTVVIMVEGGMDRKSLVVVDCMVVEHTVEGGTDVVVEEERTEGAEVRGILTVFEVGLDMDIMDLEEGHLQVDHMDLGKPFC